MTRLRFALQELTIGLSATAMALTVAAAHGAEPSVTADAALKSRSVEDAYQQSRVVGFALEGQANHALDTELTVRVSGAAFVETGTSQSFFSSEHKPASSLSLYEASLQWTPHPALAIKGGALSQTFHDNPLLMQYATFPGALERIEIGDGLKLTLMAEQAVPTADLSTPTPSSGRIALPYYGMERATLSRDFGGFAFETRASHFAFVGLPSGVAAESRFRGNSVTGVGDAGSQFTFAFQGFEAGTRLTIRPTGIADFSLGGAWLRNLSAPQGAGQGYHVFAESRIPAGRRVTLTPRVEWFRNESDSSPGYYNSGMLAHNNRQGLGVGILSEFAASNLALDARFVRAAVIETSPFQSDFTGFYLSLRKSYAWL